jgi:hypothetical protein
VELHADGSFTYTPKRNKVGVDSFTYTATDPAGKVSREATVTIQILKPTDDARYLDTAQFEAEWLRHTGIFQGEKLGNSLCFQPEKPVSRGEFITMAMKLFSDGAGAETLNESVPKWLQPYYAAAVRSGLVAGLETGHFAYDRPITGEAAALMLQNALDLTAAEEAMAQSGEAAVSPLQILGSYGIDLPGEDNLTRGQAARALYAAARLAEDAPGMLVIRKAG